MAARKKAPGKKKKATAAPKTGDVIERRFKGKVYRLRVTEDGFALAKQTFRSLTAAAKHVTGYPSVSGVRFWLGQAKKGGAR